MSKRPLTAPSHRPTISFPHRRGTFVICDVKPVGKARGVKGYCKYCYRTHRSWWLMPKEEYPAPGYGDADTRAFLCGYCEHVSLGCYMNIEEQEGA
jgi:hypothetical protein